MSRSSGWRKLLWPLSALYSMVSRLRVWCYAHGVFRSRRLPGTVISVGNLTVGGTGKTPWCCGLRSGSRRKGSKRQF